MVQKHYEQYEDFSLQKLHDFLKDDGAQLYKHKLNTAHLMDSDERVAYDVHKLDLSYYKRDDGLVDIIIDQYNITIGDVLDLGFVVRDLYDLDRVSNTYPSLSQYRCLYHNEIRTVFKESLASVVSILLTTDPEEIPHNDYYKRRAYFSYLLEENFAN